MRSQKTKVTAHASEALHWLNGLFIFLLILLGLVKKEEYIIVEKT
jgi:cytochrome b561